MAEHTSLKNLGVDGMLSAASVLSQPAESFGNNPQLELQWAVKAYEHAEIYFNLLCAVDPRLLRLTPHDEDIYKHFREAFANFHVDVVDEEKLKSADAKVLWRKFCSHYDGKVEEFNFGTLLRIDCKKDYSEENTILVTRIQFLAVEVARNKEGYNDFIRQKS